MSSSSLSSSSSSSIDNWDILDNPIVALASRDYGEGRILIHTDRMGAFQTGHADNTNAFWRKILEWTANKDANELIKIGVIANVNSYSASKMNSLSPLKVTNLNMNDLAMKSLSAWDCLYFIGLPDSVNIDVAQKIKLFVENGGGLILEYPNRGDENINILSAIESVYCYSSERLVRTYAYWTLDGVNHPVYFYGADMAFMSTIRELDLSSDWDVLMTNVENLVTTTTTLIPYGGHISVTGKASAEFGVSFINAFKNGLVTLTDSPYEFASSTSSQNSSSSSSSLDL